MNRADDLQKQGSFYYDVYKEFQLIFEKKNIEGFDLESSKQFVDFISMKVKSETVIDLSEFMYDGLGHDHSSMIEQLFFYN